MASSNEQDTARNVQEPVADAIVSGIMGRLGTPVGHLELLLTLDCNQRCDYCFIHGDRTSCDMPLPVAQQAVDYLIAASGSLADVSVLPFGGEPLLRFDLLRAIVDYACYAARDCQPSKRISFSLTTNGTLLDEHKMAFFQANGIMVLLSLDGDQTTHDHHRPMATGGSSYAEIIQRLPVIKRYQPWLGTRMTVHPDMASQVLHNFEHLQSMGINQFIIGPATGMSWTPERWDEYEQQMVLVLRRYAMLRRAGAPLRVNMFERDIESKPGAYKGSWGCGAGRGRMAVTYDGSLYPCSKIVGVDAMRGTYRLGDVWSGITDYANRAEFLRTGEDKRPRCQVCKYRDDCSGGCPATNFEATGSIFDPCELDCAMTRLAVRLRRELAEYTRTQPEPKRKSLFFGGLKHIRPIG